MKLIRRVAAGLCGCMAMLSGLAQTASRWDQPAAALAGQIAAIMGPGQARLTIRNISTIPNDAIAPIQKLLEQDLKTHGVTLAEEESANAIRVTLSENAHERIWVAEVVEGNGSQVAMVELGSKTERPAPSATGLTLRLQQILTSSRPILSTLETTSGLIALEPEEIVLYARTPAGLREQSRVSIGQRRPLPRDPRGILIGDASGTGFEAWLAGTECSGPLNAGPNEWTVNCQPSDDPWPVAQSVSGSSKAFYNGSRNYFTGVMTPDAGGELPAFYSAGWIPRVAGTTAMIAAGIDGKVLMVENGVLKPVSGTRDWGSDFAAIGSGCGSGVQIIASSSGEAAMDSLRAYELPGLEAVPVSAPLELSGTVMALWPAPDGKSVFAVVRGATDQYEVDRVSALCN